MSQLADVLWAKQLISDIETAGGLKREDKANYSSSDLGMNSAAQVSNPNTRCRRRLHLCVSISESSAPSPAAPRNSYHPNSAPSCRATLM